MKIFIYCPKCKKLVPIKWEFNCEDNHYSDLSYDHTGRIVLSCPKHGRLCEIDEFDGLLK